MSAALVLKLTAIGRAELAERGEVPPEVWAAIEYGFDQLLGPLPYPRLSSRVCHVESAALPVTPLEAEEVEHYEWLIHGLLHGARKAAERTEVPVSALEAVEEARELFAELVARIPVAVRA